MLITFGGLSAVPVTLTLEERELQGQIDAIRKGGFADIELDNLHGSIARSLFKIKLMTDSGTDKKHGKFLGDVPKEVPDVFSKDSGGKTYLSIELSSGESFADYPNTYLYNSKVYIYPSDDAKALDKLVLEFKRTNSKGEVFIREMRRLINPTPKGISKIDESKVDAVDIKPDDNNDITLEYYNSNEGESIWPNSPIQPQPPSVVNKLNDPKETLPYNKQRAIIEKYKVLLRSINKAVAKKLYLLELDRNRMVSKMLEFY